MPLNRPAAAAAAASRVRSSSRGASTAAWITTRRASVSRHRVCTYCGLRYCFGARKRGPQQGCLVKKLVEGGEIGPTDLGLNAKPISEQMSVRIKERAEELKAKANETNTATQTVPHDDLYADGDSD